MLLAGGWDGDRRMGCEWVSEGRSEFLLVAEVGLEGFESLLEECLQLLVIVGDGTVFGGIGDGGFDGEEGGLGVDETQGADGVSAAAEAEDVDALDAFGQTVALFPQAVFQQVASIGFGGGAKGYAVLAAVNVVVEFLLETPRVASSDEQQFVIVGKGGVGNGLRGSRNEDVNEPCGLVVVEEAGVGLVADVDVVDTR